MSIRDENLKDALQNRNGVINGSKQCKICENNFEWYAPIKKDFTEIDNSIKSEAVLEDSLNSAGSLLWTYMSIYSVCPYCGIKQKFKVKYLIKE